MLRRGSLRRCHGRHRLDALALDRHQQPNAIIAQRRRPVGMAYDAGQPVYIRGKPPLAPLDGTKTHLSPPLKNESSYPNLSASALLRGFMTQ
jgi:hypothetical protein